MELYYLIELVLTLMIVLIPRSIQILDSDKYTFYNDDVRNLFNITQNIYKENIEAIYSQYQSDDVDPEVI